MKSVKNLEQLKTLMENNELYGITEEVGFKINEMGLETPEYDWTKLPSFGGEEPEDTTGVWSWDEKNVLVGESAYDLEIVSRDEWFN